MNPPKRCAWPGVDPLYVAYHDEEWGVPVFDDRALFEKLVLDGFQAGLAWITVLRKRKRFIQAFDRFEPEKVAAFDQRRIDELLADPGIIRSRAKIDAAIGNARAWLKLREGGTSFSELLWSFTEGRTKTNRRMSLDQIPAATPESTSMAKELKSRGFKFVGPTICYAFMQAVGMVNDHVVSCFRYEELIREQEMGGRR
ncbi:MAG: DNA-3-methyladenine glycosylase I [Gemmatimonadetes bacterium]|nr:DNA-3-methyladenine glycosylase I [Gemmatimonadota bacterium]